MTPMETPGKFRLCIFVCTIVIAYAIAKAYGALWLYDPQALFTFGLVAGIAIGFMGVVIALRPDKKARELRKLKHDVELYVDQYKRSPHLIRRLVRAVRENSDD